MIWRKRSAPPPDPIADPDLPGLGAPVAVIGDVHGRDDLLDRLLARLSALPEARQMRVICVGDMVDRGPDSLAVLRRLHALETTPAPFASLTCLMGNHDRMMLDFLDAPARHGPRWLQYGGAETLASFGLSPERAAVRGDAAQRLGALAEAAAETMGADLRDWLAARPLSWTEDTLWVTHAGADPRRSPEAQGAAEFLWGGAEFYDRSRSDGLWVAHGHRIVPAPLCVGGRVAVDTGAWRTGRLTAAVLGMGPVQFHTT